jgi:PAS domain S-box-containing protein
LRTASDGIHIIDEHGYLVMASDSFYAMHGLTAEEAIGLHISDWDTRWSPDNWQTLLTELLTSSNTDRFDTRHRRKDGSLFDVELSTRSMELDHHPFLSCSARDITERKEVERLLKQSEDRFRTMVENTTDWTWETDAEHRLTMVTPSSDATTGISVVPILGKRRWDIAARNQIDPALWERHKADLNALRNFRDFRYWVPTPMGQDRWFSISGSPVYDERGVFTGYRGWGTDVTAEAETAAQLKLLSSLVEQSPASAIVTDPNFVIQYANPETMHLSGYESDELVGRKLWDLNNGVSPDQISTVMKTLADRVPWSGDLPSRRKDGQMLWLHLAVNFIDDDFRQIKHYVIVADDITDRKRNEAQILRANQLLDSQAKKLQSVNAELEQFAYVASHDLRQPLRMISSYLDLIKMKLGDQLDDEIKTFIGFAIDGAKRLDRLILDLL